MDPPGEAVERLSAVYAQGAGEQSERTEAMGFRRVPESRHRDEPKLWAASRNRGLA